MSSKKTLEVDSIIVETLFTRGIPVSTSQTYASILSPIGPSIPQEVEKSSPLRGQFLEWSYLPLSTIYDKYFYGINPKNILSTLRYIESQLDIPPTDALLSLNASTVSTFSSVSSLNSSSIYGFSTSLLEDRSKSIERYNEVKNVLLSASSVILELSTTFYTTSFTPLSNTLMERGEYYYIKRPDILPTPVPWYLQGLPEKYVGPSLSSMYIYSQLNAALIASYCDILANISIGWSTSNAVVQEELDDYVALATFGINSVDTGSSISTYFTEIKTSFASSLSSEFYGGYVSSVSSSLSSYFYTYTIPTDGPYISTGVVKMINMNSTLQSSLLSQISSGVLGDNISSFSTIVSSTVESVEDFLYIQNNIQSLSTLNTVFSSTLVSTLNLLSVSTNQEGYETLSTLYPVIFSTFADVLPYIVLSNTQLYDLTTVIAKAATVSSFLTPQLNSILDLNTSFQTAPGISSLFFNLSTTLSTSYDNYSALLSSPSSLLGISTAILTSILNGLVPAHQMGITILPLMSFANEGSSISQPGADMLEKITSLRLVSYTSNEGTVKYRSQDPSYGGVRIASSYIDSTPSQRSTTKSQIQGIFDFVPCGRMEVVKPRYGFHDFNSVDTDRLVKANYVATLGLVERFQSVESRITRLLKTLEE